MAKDFFAPWTDSKSADALYLGIALILLTFLIALYTNFYNLPELQSEAGRVLIFILLLITSLIVVVLLQRNNPATLGENWTKTGIAMAGGVVAFLVFAIFGHFSIAAPFSAIISQQNLGFFYVVIASPLVEEIFFSGALFFGFRELMLRFGSKGFLKSNAGILSAFLVSGTFAFFHVAVYGGSSAALFQAFIFRFVVIVGNSFSNSLGFGFAWHALNNLVAFS